MDTIDQLGDFEGIDFFDDGPFEDFEDFDGEDADFESASYEPEPLGWDADGEDLYETDGIWEADDMSDFEAVVGEPDYRESDFYAEYEADFWDEADDEFFKKIGRWVKKTAKKVGGVVKAGIRTIAKFAGPLLKVLGPVAAKIVGGAIGGPAGAAIAGTLTSALLKEAEFEDEGDADSQIEEDETLLESIGFDEASYDLMAEAAGRVTASPDEAVSSRAIVGMIGHGYRAFARNPRLRPHLAAVMRAAVALAATFRANPKTRWAVQVIPLIVSRTMLRLARTRTITKRTLVEAMARETAWTLANPRRARAALAAMKRRQRRGQLRRKTR